MKTISLFISLLICSINITVAQFDATWELNLQNDNHKEQISLTQDGNTVRGKLSGGGKFNATWNEKGNKLSGYFKYNRKNPL